MPTIADIKTQINDARDDLQSKEDTIKKADAVSNQLADLTDTLDPEPRATWPPAIPPHGFTTPFGISRSKYKVDISVNSQLSIGPSGFAAAFSV